MPVLRTKTLAGDYVHVDMMDPALDSPDASNKPAALAFLETYNRAMETGNVSALPVRPDRSPIIWRFRHLSIDEVVWLADRGHGTVTLNLDTLALALVGVSNVEEEPGKAFVIERKRDPHCNGFMAVSRDNLDALLRDDTGHIDAQLLGRLSNRVWSELVPRKG